MKTRCLSIPGVVLIEPELFKDERGYFFEAFNQTAYDVGLNKSIHFVQDNQSYSKKNVLRGLHYQVQHVQGKLTRVLAGETYSVVVDLRKDSPTFGQWIGVHLSSENRHQLWIPEGCAHGFLVLSDYAETLYKVTDYWMKQYERCIAWNDPTLNIAWPLESQPILSDKDQQAIFFSEATYL